MPSLVFFGTPFFSAEILRYLLHKHYPILAVVTQPDRPQKRSKELIFSEVKTIAIEHGIPVLQPIKASNSQFLEELAALKADLFLVVAFGQILPQKLLNLPPLGCINVHTSLLPAYRGAAPIRRCLMDGKSETGICVQKMVYKLDAGDVIDSLKVPVPEEMTFGELEALLCDQSKHLLEVVLTKYQKGIPEGVVQDESQVTYAHKLQAEDEKIDWSKSSKELHNLVRAMSPAPGAYTEVDLGKVRKKLKILRSRVSGLSGAPGALVLFEKGRCVVGTGGGALELLQVQLEGKRTMSTKEWMQGCRSNLKFLIQ